MCFYNSMSKNAMQIAKRYGKQLDVVEAYRKILEEKEREEQAKNETVNLYETRIAEAMYNIPAYSEPKCVIISSSRELQIMQWGLLPRTAKQKDVDRYNTKNWFKNARGEDIFETWPYRDLIMHRRCLIPSTGFMEYHHFSPKDKQPYFITIPSREVFCMGGLWECWPIPGKSGVIGGGYDLDNPDFENYIYSFTQITIDATDFMRQIHNGGEHPFRMPLILREEDEKRWLDSSLSVEEVRSLIVPYTYEKMDAYPIDKSFRKMSPYSQEVIKMIEIENDLVLV